MNLAEHPYFDATDPRKSRLVRISKPFPGWLNPFADDGVVIQAAAIPGEVEHSKDYMARQLIVGGIRDGDIDQNTIIEEATSGNTGNGLAKVCKAIGLRGNFYMPAGTVQGKLDPLRVMGSGIEVLLHTDPNESAVARARRLGAQPGHFNPDQYANKYNWMAHHDYLAPQLFEAAEGVSMLLVASGTMGSALGPKIYADEHGLPVCVVPVVLEEHQEVPGVRPLSTIKRDIRQPWQEHFSLDDFEYGTRHPSFLLAYYSWRWVPQMLGPSFGLAFQGALRRLYKEREAGTLDRRRINGKVRVFILGADTYRPYLNLFIGETQGDERHTYKEPDLLELAL